MVPKKSTNIPKQKITAKKRWITEKSLQDAINAVKNQEVSKRAASKKLVYLE